jgi:uncharacterized protein (TIGR02246 family)
MAHVNRSDVRRWVDAYERAWRTAGTDLLAELFAPDASYLMSPWRAPLEGLDAIARFWEEGRDGPDEPFTMTSEVVAVEDPHAVVRVHVDYGPRADGTPGSRWRDLWVMRFSADGRCVAFEEWPFAPGQHDGQEAAG